MTITLLTIRLFLKPCGSESEVLEVLDVVGVWVDWVENWYPERENVDEEFEPVGWEDGACVCFLTSDFFFCSRVFLCLLMLKA